MNEPTLRDWFAMHASMQDVEDAAKDIPYVETVRADHFGNKRVVVDKDPDRMLKARYIVADKLLKIRESA
jgi:hypothetical protein